MSSIVTLLYPSTAKFDMDYYISKHMPFVEASWSKHGLKEWKVVRLDKSTGYQTQCILFWDNLEFFNRVIVDETDEVVMDIKNFSDVAPIRIWGDEVKAME